MAKPLKVVPESPGGTPIAVSRAAAPCAVPSGVVLFASRQASASEPTELLRRHPETRVVLVTVHDDPAFVERGRAAGALGHVLKLAAATDLMPAFHAALRNERYVSSRLRGRPSER